MIKRFMYGLFLFNLWIGGTTVASLLYSSIVTLLVVYVVLPLLYVSCPSLPRHLIFLNFVAHPFGYDFKTCRKWSIFSGNCVTRVKNFRIKVDSDVELGVWHLSPTNENYDFEKHKDHEDALRYETSPVILYLHGNTSNRGTCSRVNTYEMIRKLGYHIVAPDYRGYGDSTAVAPTEEGIVQDALVTYRWLEKLVGRRRILVWGHSLGTGVASHMCALMAVPPTGVILEAPFNNIQDEVKMHPLTAVYRQLPMFDQIFIEPLTKAGIHFKSDQHLKNVVAPIMILHAEDDLVVPYLLGRRLHDFLTRERAVHMPPVTMVSLAGHHHYGHKFISRDPTVPTTVRDFISKAVEDYQHQGSNHVSSEHPKDD